MAYIPTLVNLQGANILKKLGTTGIHAKSVWHNGSFNLAVPVSPRPQCVPPPSLINGRAPLAPLLVSDDQEVKTAVSNMP